MTTASKRKRPDPSRLNPTPIRRSGKGLLFGWQEPKVLPASRELEDEILRDTFRHMLGEGSEMKVLEEGTE